MGIPPRRFAGWAPKTRSRVVDGETVTTTEPEWDWVDRAIVRAWQQLNERLCPQCRRPLSLHRAETDTQREQGSSDPDDAASRRYNVGFLTCPATLALDRAQADLEDADAAKVKTGRRPDRARTWLTWRDDEQPPTFPDD